MLLLTEIITYLAISILTLGLWSSFKNRSKQKELCFLSGTLILVLSASINYIFLGTLEVFAFVLLFLLQAIANILVVFSREESVNTAIVISFTMVLFLFFFLSGLLYNAYFFIISVGTALAAFGYKEPSEHLIRQNIFLMIAAFFESAFAFLTGQYIYIILNVPFILFGALIISENN